MGALPSAWLRAADVTTPDAIVYVQQKLRRMGVERGGARGVATVTSCASARSSSRTRRRCESRMNASARGRSRSAARRSRVLPESSTTRRWSSSPATSREAVRRRPPRRARAVGRDRGGNAGARTDHPPTRHRNAPGDRRGRPAASSRAHERPARRGRCGRGPSAAHAVRLRASLAVSPRGAKRHCDTSSTSACCRSSTRTTPWPTTRSATATTIGSRRWYRTCSVPTCC